MNDLIEQIAVSKGLSVLKISDDKLSPTLFYYEDKNDFFLLISSDYPTFIHQLELIESENLIDLGINAYLDSLKQHEAFKRFGNSVDFNLSCIVAMQLSTLDNSEVLKTIHGVEENYKISKKYILPYLNDDLKQLKDKVNDETLDGDFSEKLNSLASKHSNLINIKDESWYRLLMNLFIKLPFLNYQSGSFGLVTISEYMDNELSTEDLLLLENIRASYDESTDIESFISQFKIGKDEQI